VPACFQRVFVCMYVRARACVHTRMCVWAWASAFGNRRRSPPPPASPLPHVTLIRPTIRRVLAAVCKFLPVYMSVYLCIRTCTIMVTHVQWVVYAPTCVARPFQSHVPHPYIYACMHKFVHPHTILSVCAYVRVHGWRPTVNAITRMPMSPHNILLCGRAAHRHLHCQNCVVARNRLQAAFLNESLHGIPITFINEGLHGGAPGGGHSHGRSHNDSARLLARLLAPTPGLRPGCRERCHYC